MCETPPPKENVMEVMDKAPKPDLSKVMLNAAIQRLATARGFIHSGGSAAIHHTHEQKMRLSKAKAKKKAAKLARRRNRK